MSRQVRSNNTGSRHWRTTRRIIRLWTLDARGKSNRSKVDDKNFYVSANEKRPVRICTYRLSIGYLCVFAYARLPNHVLCTVPAQMTSLCFYCIVFRFDQNVNEQQQCAMHRQSSCIMHNFSLNLTLLHLQICTNYFLFSFPICMKSLTSVALPNRIAMIVDERNTQRAPTRGKRKHHKIYVSFTHSDSRTLSLIRTTKNKIKNVVVAKTTAAYLRHLKYFSEVYFRFWCFGMFFFLFLRSSSTCAALLSPRRHLFVIRWHTRIKYRAKKKNWSRLRANDVHTNRCWMSVEPFGDNISVFIFTRLRHSRLLYFE